MTKSLFEYYLKNQDELVKLYNGKYVVITEAGVVGAYDSLREGYDDAVAKYGKGNFLLQLCTEGDTAYTQRCFNPRVSFVW